MNNIVKDTRQVVLPDSRIGLQDYLSAVRCKVVQQQAAFDIEKHRHQVAAYMGGKLGEPRESSAMRLRVTCVHRDDEFHSFARDVREAMA